MRAILQELVYDSPAGGAVWPFDRRYIRPPHFHGQVEVLVIRRGTAVLHLGARAVPVKAGQACWVLPCVPHVMSGFSPDFDMWVLEWEPSLVDECWRAVRSESPSRPLFDSVAVLGERLAGRTVVDVGPDNSRAMDELASCIWNAPSTAGLRDALVDLCAFVLRVTLTSVDPRRDISIAELASCRLLSAPLLDRRALATDLGVSEGCLSRAFGRGFGVSLVEHRARTRVAHFLALMQGGKRNLLDAALAGGFGSYSQFHRVFTRIAQITPRRYFTSGRHRMQLFVAGDVDRPQAAPARMLSSAQRQPPSTDGRELLT